MMPAKDEANLLDDPRATGLWALRETVRAGRSPRRYRLLFAVGLVLTAILVIRAL